MSTRNQYRYTLQLFQSARLRRDHSDLAVVPQYRAAGEFFFDDMYGARDFSERDAGARRLHNFLHIVPGVRINDVEEVLELLELTYRLDEDLISWFQALDAPLDFDEALYEFAYRKADNYDHRLHQINLVRSTLLNVHHLTRIPLLGFTLKRATLVAHLAGLGELHRFLVRGYTALQDVQDAHWFADTIYQRERQRLDRIYAQ